MAGGGFALLQLACMGRDHGGIIQRERWLGRRWRQRLGGRDASRKLRQMICDGSARSTVCGGELFCPVSKLCRFLRQCDHAGKPLDLSRQLRKLLIPRGWIDSGRRRRGLGPCRREGEDLWPRSGGRRSGSALLQRRLLLNQGPMPPGRSTRSQPAVARGSVWRPRGRASGERLDWLPVCLIPPCAGHTRNCGHRTGMRNDRVEARTARSGSGGTTDTSSGPDPVIRPS